MEAEIITVAAAVKGPCQLLEPFIRKLDKWYRISGIEYSSKDSTSWVKCKIENHIHTEFLNLTEIVSADLNISKKEIRYWRRRTKNVVLARDIIAFVMHMRHELSYPEIAELMHASSHASALKSCNKFDSSGKDIEIYIKTCSLERAYTICKGKYTQTRKPYTRKN